MTRFIIPKHISTDLINLYTPVLDISFPATKPWSVHSQSNGFETSPFSSSHKLFHHISVFVHLNKHNASLGEKHYIKDLMLEMNEVVHSWLLKQKSILAHKFSYIHKNSLWSVLTYSWKNRMPGPVEATSSTLEVAHEERV